MPKEEKQKKEAKAPEGDKNPIDPPAPVNENEDVKRLQDEMAKLKAQLADAQAAKDSIKGNSDKILAEKRELEDKLKGLGNYERVTKILAALGDAEEADLIAEGKHEQVYAARHDKFLTDVHNPLIAERDSLKEQLANLRAEYQDKAKTDPLQEAWIKAKGKPNMFKYVAGQAKDTFRFDDDGKLLPYDAQGNIIYGTGGSEPMTPEQYFNAFLMNEPDFKVPSKGTSANGGDGGKLQITGNPWSASYTGSDKYQKRLEISKAAPQEAERLKREAKAKS